MLMIVVWSIWIHARFGSACVCLARGHQGRAQGLRCKFGLHTKQEWKDAQVKVDLAEVASANKAAPRDPEHALPAIPQDASESCKSKRQQSDSRQDHNKKAKEHLASPTANKRVSSDSELQAPASAASGRFMGRDSACVLREHGSIFSDLRSCEDPSSPERNRRLVSERGNAARSEAPWLRDLTRPLSPFTGSDAMIKRNKDLAVRIKEELGGSERCQEAVTIGWQRFKQLTGQFSSGHIDCSCYLSSFLNLFPNDPHRRHTERRCGMLRELATTCPSNREDLQAAYLHIVRSFGGGGDAAPAGLANAGKTAAAIIKGTLSSNALAHASRTPRAPQQLSGSCDSRC